MVTEVQKMDVQQSEEALSRREREREAHRREIMEAAVRIFARKGFAASTMEEIAYEAEFSKGAVYLHFGSKEELIVSILQDLQENTILTGLREVLDGSRTLRLELQALYRRAAELAFAHELHMSLSAPIHLCKISGLSEETREKVSAFHDEALQLIRQRVEIARATGELRNVSLEAVVGLIDGSLDSLVLTRWGCESMDELAQAADEVIDIMFDGIGIRKEGER